MPRDGGIDERFAAYVRARGQHHLRVAVLLTGDWHAAEDLVQASLAKLYRAWPRLDTATDPDAYLRRIMINTHRSWWRTRWRRETPAAELPDQPARAGDPADRHAAGDQVRRALATLPRQQRAVLARCATSRTCRKPRSRDCSAVRPARSRPTPIAACAPCATPWAPASIPPR
jgi:RNA polymerase sigma factor (sigma-70 family)